MPGQPQCIWPVAAQLGEGPLYQATSNALWFVDIKGHRIHRYQFDDEAAAAGTPSTRSWPAPDQVGFIVPTANDLLLCGLRTGLHWFDPDTGAFSEYLRLPYEADGNRLNDAHVDASGRLWFGSMDDGEQHPTGALYCLQEGQLQRRDDGYIITNGPATSPDGSTLYHVDTLQRVIYAFALHADGSLGPRREFARIQRPGAYPDGPCVDAEGCLWIALFGGWGVQRYSPAGELIDFIELPVANCTKVTFGGPQLRTMFITTAWKGLSAEQRAAQPLAGGLFQLPVNVAGQPQHAVRLT